MSKTIPVSSDLSFWLHYEDCPMILSEFKVVHKTLNIKMLDQQGARKQNNYLSITKKIDTDTLFFM